MSNKHWEIYAAYGGLSADDLARIMSDRNLNPFTRSELLTSALPTPFKEIAREHYRSLVREGYPKQIAEGLDWISRLGLEPSPIDGLATLPQYSFALEFQFVLTKPYLSQDDGAFYVIDNPVRKDKVFKVPYVSPTSWKGSLRAAATRGLLDTFSRLLSATPPPNEAERATMLQALWAERARRVALFGDEKESQAAFLNRWLASHILPKQPDRTAPERRKQVQEEANRLGREFEQYLIQHGYRTEKIEGRQGRLFFYPTFFNQIDLEIINPHDRKRRVGKKPILFECVPAGARGCFALLYVPFDRIGNEEADSEKGVKSLREEVMDDFVLLARTLRAMFTKYGFGAKTSSGFGRARVLWKKEEGAKVQPENELWNEWERTWREEEPNE